MVSEVPYIPKRFLLERYHDHSGVSGTGVVAFGIQFADGKCVTRWNGEIAQTAVWDSIEDIDAIHGHNGSTKIVFIDV